PPRRIPPPPPPRRIPPPPPPKCIPPPPPWNPPPPPPKCPPPPPPPPWPPPPPPRAACAVNGVTRSAADTNKIVPIATLPFFMTPSCACKRDAARAERTAPHERRRVHFRPTWAPPP